MSKSLNLFLPAIGITALLLGMAYGISTRNFRAEEAELARHQAAQADARAATEAAKVAELSADLDSVAASATAGQGDAMPEVATLVLGRPALVEEVAAWDIDIRPDGAGLPNGSGDVLTGEEVFTDNCAMCHGDFGEAVGRWPVLAGGFDTLDSEDPVKTIGSYWPYLSTVFDYVNRAMPFGNAQSLVPDDVYAITAYLMYLNDLVDEDFELSHANFTDVEMPNSNSFFMDDRAEVEYAAFSEEPCMQDCKDSVEITGHARVVDVTPDETAARAEGAAGPETNEELRVAAHDASAVSEDHDTIDPALAAAGEKAFKKCAACHAVGTGAKNKTGPQLNDLVGRPIGGLDGFKYSTAFKTANEEGRVWDEESLSAFLAKPKAYIEGTKMSFSGFRKEGDIAAVIAFLNAQGS